MRGAFYRRINEATQQRCQGLCRQCQMCCRMAESKNMKKIQCTLENMCSARQKIDCVRLSLGHESQSSHRLISGISLSASLVTVIYFLGIQFSVWLLSSSSEAHFLDMCLPNLQYLSSLTRFRLLASVHGLRQSQPIPGTW